MDLPGLGRVIICRVARRALAAARPDHAAGDAIDDGWVQVQNGRIAAVGPGASGTADLSVASFGGLSFALVASVVVIGLLALSVRLILPKERLSDASLSTLFQTSTRWNAFVALANFVIVPAVAYGSQLALGALGVTLIYGILRFSNFAHGDPMAFGARLDL